MASIINGVGTKTNTSHLEQARAKLNQTLQRLSTGSRINNAHDDAAGLQISDNLRADIRINNQARINANNGLGRLNVADSTLSESSNLLARAAEITVQAASGTTSQAGKDALNAEYQEILSSLDSIHANTKFDGQALFGSSTDVRVGETASETVQLNVGSVNSGALGLAGGDISTAAGASAALSNITSAIESVSANRGEIGAKQGRLENTINTLATVNEAVAEAESQIRDADIADEVVKKTQADILSKSSASALSHRLDQQKSVLSLLQ